MIPRLTLEQWSLERPWQSDTQVEQDLLLAQLIVEIARDPLLGEELTLRGGTCLHKLHLRSPRRYSEDLDFVRSTAGGIGPILTALKDLGRRIGYSPISKIGRYPKVLFRTEAANGAQLRIKVEINTYERSPALPLVAVPFSVDSVWFTGEAKVRTFATEELVATKIRALYQRKKGRDLFDLWLAITELGLSPAAIVGAFGPYRPEGITSGSAAVNLRAKIEDPDFVEDLRPLVAEWPKDYDIETAADLVIDEVLSRL